MAKSNILKSIHESVKGLHSAGLISDITMKEYDKPCLSPVHKFTPKEIQKLRKREKVSQPIFAALLNTTVSTIQKWEIGQKQPSGLALKLLNIVEKKGIEGII